MKIGVKSVSMDDLAGALGMSKKTIYQHFRDKRALINEVFDRHLELDKSTCEMCFGKDANAIQQLIDMSEHVHKSLKDMHPALMFDIQKYYPNCWQKFKQFSREFIFNHIKNNLIKGQEEGLYRMNMNPEVVASIYVCLVQHMVQPEFQIGQKVNVSELQQEAISYHLYSICTPKGLEYLNQYYKQ